MSRYDRMASISPAVEREAWLHRNVERVLAARLHRPYCFKCDLLFGSHEALKQHTRDKHGDQS